MHSILISIVAIALISFPTIVAAQTSSPTPDDSPSFEPPRRTPRRTTSPPPEPAKPPEQYQKKIEDIKNKVSSNKEVKTMCNNYLNQIKYQFYGDKLRIDTGNNNCAFTIIKTVIQPQLSEGKIRTYEYTGDREGVVVTF
jgi:hypothetical protein